MCILQFILFHSPIFPAVAYWNHSRCIFHLCFLRPLISTILYFLDIPLRNVFQRKQSIIESVVCCSLIRTTHYHYPSVPIPKLKCKSDAHWRAFHSYVLRCLIEESTSASAYKIVSFLVRKQITFIICSNIILRYKLSHTPLLLLQCACALCRVYTVHAHTSVVVRGSDARCHVLCELRISFVYNSHLPIVLELVIQNIITLSNWFVYSEHFLFIQFFITAHAHFHSGLRFVICYCFNIIVLDTCIHPSIVSNCRYNALAG